MARRPQPQARPIAVAAGVALSLVAFAFGGLASCLIEVDRGLSCGDGWRDPLHEACDPNDPDRAFEGACRELGFMIDATCDPVTCEILDDVASCNICGDGVRAQDEACDGDDIPDSAVCPAGSVGTVRCTDDCTLDTSDCPAQCGDGLVTGDEECDPEAGCKEDADCELGQACWLVHGICVNAGSDFGPSLDCAHYNVTGLPEEKHAYTSGEIERCSDTCYFGRNDCSFCGDGVVDKEYDDISWPVGTTTIPAEICDGDQVADLEALADYCRPICTDGPVDPNLQVYCDFECNGECTGFALPDDIAMGATPEELSCCLAPGTLCPIDNDNVPDLPCCGWGGGLQQCVWSSSPPIVQICP